MGHVAPLTIITETEALKKEEDYTVAGYKTILPERSNTSNLVRMVCLIKDAIIRKTNFGPILSSKDLQLHYNTN